MFRNSIVGLLAGLLVLTGGCVIQPVNAPTSVGSGTIQAAPTVGEPQVVDATGYELKPLDPIYVSFSGITEQAPLELVIDENGEIKLLHIKDPIKAAGMTTSKLSQEIERLYIEGGIYKNVSVNVTMTAKVYYVQGEVLQPGQFQLMSGTTLLQAIAGARGYTPYADRNKVTITRYGKIYTYSTKKIEKDPSTDVKIEAGDVIKVWQTWY